MDRLARHNRDIEGTMSSAWNRATELRPHLVREEHDNKKQGCQWRPLESSGDMMCACVQLAPSAHAVPLVGAVVALTLTTIMNPRSATLETSISATGDSSKLVFASTTSAEVEIVFVGRGFLLTNQAAPVPGRPEQHYHTVTNREA